MFFWCGYISIRLMRMLIVLYTYIHISTVQMNFYVHIRYLSWFILELHGSYMYLEPRRNKNIRHGIGIRTYTHITSKQNIYIRLSITIISFYLCYANTFLHKYSFSLCSNRVTRIKFIFWLDFPMFQNVFKLMLYCTRRFYVYEPHKIERDLG